MKGRPGQSNVEYSTVKQEKEKEKEKEKKKKTSTPAAVMMFLVEAFVKPSQSCSRRNSQKLSSLEPDCGKKFLHLPGPMIELRRRGKKESSCWSSAARVNGACV